MSWAVYIILTGRVPARLPGPLMTPEACARELDYWRAYDAARPSEAPTQAFCARPQWMPETNKPPMAEA